MSDNPTASVSLQLPTPGTPWLDASGNVAPVWYNVLLRLVTRTGGVPGININGALSDLQVLVVEDMIPPPDAAMESILTAVLTTIPTVSAGGTQTTSEFTYGPETRVPPDVPTPTIYGPETRVPQDPSPSVDQTALLAQLMQVP